MCPSSAWFRHQGIARWRLGTRLPELCETVLAELLVLVNHLQRHDK